MRALCSILGFHWQEHFTNLEVLDRTESISIEAMLIKVQLRWVGHVIREADHHCVSPITVRRTGGWQEKAKSSAYARYKDLVKGGTASNQRNWRLQLVTDVAGVTVA